MKITSLVLALFAALAVAACEEEVGDDAAVIEEPAETTTPAVE